MLRRGRRVPARVVAGPWPWPVCPWRPPTRRTGWWRRESPWWRCCRSHGTAPVGPPAAPPPAPPPSRTSASRSSAAAASPPPLALEPRTQPKNENLPFIIFYDFQIILVTGIIFLPILPGWRQTCGLEPRTGERPRVDPAVSPCRTCRKIPQLEENIFSKFNLCTNIMIQKIVGSKFFQIKIKTLWEHT